MAVLWNVAPCGLEFTDGCFKALDATIISYRPDDGGSNSFETSVF
jgi:hypothetical protein